MQPGDGEGRQKGEVLMLRALRNAEFQVQGLYSVWHFGEKMLHLWFKD